MLEVEHEVDGEVDEERMRRGREEDLLRLPSWYGKGLFLRERGVELLI